MKVGEKVCVAHISKQSNNESQGQINLRARNNKPITLKVSKARFERKKAKYNDTQIPKSEITKLKLDTGMSDRNVKKRVIISEAGQVVKHSYQAQAKTKKKTLGQTYLSLLILSWMVS